MIGVRKMVSYTNKYKGKEEKERKTNKDLW